MKKLKPRPENERREPVSANLPKIHTIFIFNNGMVAVTDGQHQIPELQGKLTDVEGKICQAIGKQRTLPQILRN